LEEVNPLHYKHPEAHMKLLPIFVAFQIFAT